MAIKATIFKAEVQISDMDRHYYQTHNFTLARHPSETDERLMIRIIAFVLNAHEDLQFTKGLSTDDEPELWQRTLAGEIELWIDLGQLDEKRIRVIHFPDDIAKSIAKFCNRNMLLQFTIEDGELWLSDGDDSIQIKPLVWTRSLVTK